jgi:uncharacterized protein YkwD
MLRTSLALLALAFTPLLAAQEKQDELKLSKDEQALLDLVNAERKKAELPALKTNTRLMAAARDHGANMAKQEKAAHVLDDKQPADRVKAAGYAFSRLGENVAWNQRSPKEVMEDWMKSQAHKDNILKKDYTEIGVAVVKSKKGEPYWVQVFGAPRGE